MPRVALLLFLLALIPACKRSAFDEMKWKEAGSDAVFPFKKELKEALVQGLDRGPVQAISACRVEAPKIARAASARGIRVGRTSHKLRNPGNAPKLWMEPFLRTYESDPGSREPAVVLIDPHTVGYVEPIFVQPLCVTCHGPELAPDLKAKLAELYPDDQATGYAAGDFRGVFWAELPRR